VLYADLLQLERGALESVWEIPDVPCTSIPVSHTTTPMNIPVILTRASAFFTIMLDSENLQLKILMTCMATGRFEVRTSAWARMAEKGLRAQFN
jgi:hypothetical protein